jgi:hypothetical protein
MWSLVFYVRSLAERDNLAQSEPAGEHGAHESPAHGAKPPSGGGTPSDAHGTNGKGE